MYVSGRHLFLRVRCKLIAIKSWAHPGRLDLQMLSLRCSASARWPEPSLKAPADRNAPGELLCFFRRPGPSNLDSRRWFGRVAGHFEAARPPKAQSNATRHGSEALGSGFWIDVLCRRRGCPRRRLRTEPAKGTEKALQIPAQVDTSAFAALLLTCGALLCSTRPSSDQIHSCCGSFAYALDNTYFSDVASSRLRQVPSLQGPVWHTGRTWSRNWLVCPAPTTGTWNGGRVP